MTDLSNISNLPSEFLLTAAGTAGPNSITTARIWNEDHHDLGGTWVSFVVDGYSPERDENIRIRKKCQLLGHKLVLMSATATRDHDVSHFSER